MLTPLGLCHSPENFYHATPVVILLQYVYQNTNTISYSAPYSVTNLALPLCPSIDNVYN